MMTIAEAKGVILRLVNVNINQLNYCPAGGLVYYCSVYVTLFSLDIL